MLENRGTWTDLIGGVGAKIVEVFDQGQEEYQPGIFELLQKGTGTGAQEIYTGKTGVGTLRKFADGDNIPLDRRYRTYDTTVVWNNYGSGIQVTKNTLEDRDFAAELDEMKDLSIGSNYSQDESGVQLFNGGFATTVTVNGYDMTWYGDGKPLFSTIHPSTVPGASTQSNASSTGVVFNGDNLETAMVALHKQQTDNGLAITLLGKPVIVLPSDLKKEGLEITSSELDPKTAENAINVYRNGMAVDMVHSLFLDDVNGGSATAWYVTIPQRAKLYHIVRQAPQIHQSIDDMNLSVTFLIESRWADCVKDWRRTWGSKGDNLAYSS